MIEHRAYVKTELSHFLSDVVYVFSLEQAYSELRNRVTFSGPYPLEIRLRSSS